MADKKIGELPAAPAVQDDSLFPIEQQGIAMHGQGRQLREFAERSVEPYAKSAAENAAEAAQSAEKAEQYSGRPPIIQGGTWWTWNAELQEYVDTGEAARGNLMYASFMVDPLTGNLYMFTDDEYFGPEFRLNNNNLEVVINAGHTA